MTPPTSIAAAIAATWPPSRMENRGPFTLAENDGGGSRVRAARLANMDASGADVAQAEIGAAARRMQALGQPDLFMVFDWQAPLDAVLDTMGYVVRDRTHLLQTDTATLAAPPPPVTCFESWPPLAVQQEIWAEGGIGPDRLAIMSRVAGPKTALFGRINDRPAASAFVAIHGDIAMLHALEVTPRARRQGLARHMMRAAGEWARQHESRCFATLVTAENESAQSLYASLGFEPVGHYHYRTKTG